MYKGSARLSKCLLNNAVVPKGKKGKKKNSPPLKLSGVDLENSSGQVMVMAESPFGDFLSGKSTHTLTAYNTKEDMDMFMSALAHHFFTKANTVWRPHRSSGDTGAVFRTRQV